VPGDVPVRSSAVDLEGDDDALVKVVDAQSLASGCCGWLRATGPRTPPQDRLDAQSREHTSLRATLRIAQPCVRMTLTMRRDAYYSSREEPKRAPANFPRSAWPARAGRGIWLGSSDVRSCW